MRAARAAAALAILAAAGFGGGCGGDDPVATRDLAKLTPAGTLAYVEGVTRPEGEQRESIEAIAERFPGGEDLGKRIATELNQGFAKESDPETRTPTYAADVEPWLGERFAAGFYELGPGSKSDASFSALQEITDPEAAAEALDTFAAASSEEERKVRKAGLEYYVTKDEPLVAIVDDHLVIASDRERLSAAAEALRGESRSVADSESFDYAVGDVDGSRALAFASVDAKPLVRAGIAADAAATSAGAQFRRATEQMGLDLERPVTAALTAGPDEAVLDTSIAVGERGPAPELAPDAGTALIDELPADSWGASACPGCMESFGQGFESGFQQGFEAGSGLPPGAGAGLLPPRATAGLDGFEKGLGDSVVFVRGTETFALGLLAQADGGRELEGGLVAEVKDRDRVDEAVRALRRLLEGAGPLAPAPAELPDAPPGVSGFSVPIPPTSLAVAVNDDRFVLGIGAETAVEAVAGGGGLGKSAALESLRGELGSGFELNAYVDLDVAFELLTTLVGDPGVAEAEPYLEAFSRLVAGGTLTDGRLINRTLVAFD